MGLFLFLGWTTLEITKSFFPLAQVLGVFVFDRERQKAVKGATIAMGGLPAYTCALAQGKEMWA